MKKVTKWERLNLQTNLFEHVGLEDGHVAGNMPVPVTEEQKKSWSNCKFRKQFGYLDMSGKYQPIRS